MRMKANQRALITETIFFSACSIMFFIMNFFPLSEKTGNVLYIIFMLISFGGLFALEFLFPKRDKAVHFKMLKKYYIPAENGKRRESYKRKGLAAVVSLWIVYLLFVAFLKYIRVLSWQIFLSGMSLLFLLNSIFIRKTCMLSVLFLHNKNNCCKNCAINCWDYAIFASALFFAPRLSLAATAVNGVIILVSFVLLAVWEWNYHSHPYRFYPETNKALSCRGCEKKCFQSVEKNRHIKEKNYDF